MSRKWQGAWIWRKQNSGEANNYVDLRTTFRLGSLPKQTQVFISANSAYELFFNGEFVGRGPDPSDPACPYYDTWDATAFTQPGKNLLAVLAYQYGEGIPSINQQQQGAGGVLCEVEVVGRSGLKVIAPSGPNWRARKDPCWRQDANRHSRWSGFHEVYFGDKSDTWWLETGYNDHDWESASVVCPADDPKAVLGPPLPAEIPRLQITELRPAKVFRTCPNGGRIEDAENLIHALGSACRIDADQPGSFPALVLDWEREVVGWPRYLLRTQSPAIISFSYGETLDLERIDSLVLPPGVWDWHPFGRRAFRYLELTVNSADKPVFVDRVTLEFTHYPFQETAAFECDDPLVNRIFEIGLYTTLIGCQSHFEDSVWREKSQWIGDALITARVAAYGFGDTTLTKKCLRQIARIQRADGMLCGGGPQRNDFLLPDYCAHFVTLLREYYLHSGDLALVKELFPTLEQLMIWYAKVSDEHGLVQSQPVSGWWPFVDWPSHIDKRGMVTAISMTALRAHREAAALARMLGYKKLANGWMERARAIARALPKAAYHRAKRRYADCVDNGRRSLLASLQTNTYAVWTGLAKPAQWSQLLLGDYPTRRMSPFFASMYLESLTQAGLHHEALNFMRNYWGKMVARGATTWWELLDQDSGPATIPHKFSTCNPVGGWEEAPISCCHAWGSGPTWTLLRDFLGVQPLMPGFQRVRLAPAVSQFAWARGSVPTPLGELKVSWKRTPKGALWLDYKAPEGMEVEVAP